MPTFPIMPSAGLSGEWFAVKFAVLCSKTLKSHFISDYNVSDQNPVVSAGYCHFCVRL